MSDQTYFDRPEISASDIKAFLKKMGGGTEDPLNLPAIFEFGSMSHATIFEPHLAEDFDVTPEELHLALRMKKTFFSDPLNRMIVMRSDFKREEVCSKEVEVGGMRFRARCKCDGISRGIGVVLEFKGLSVVTQKAFEEAIDRLLYDLAAVLYLLVTECDKMVMVGISKIKPEMMFKKIIKKHDDLYLTGEQKLIEVLREWHQMSPDDIRMVA